MKVLLTAPLSRFSGYGNDGIGLAQALMRLGVDVYIRSRTVQAPLPQDVAMLFTKELEAPFDLSITHLDPAALILPQDTKASCAMNVAWSMWEYTTMDHMPGRSKLKMNLKEFDALVGYDEVSNAALKPYYRGPILKQQGGFEPDNWEYLERDWFSEDFYFSMVGAPLSVRKNPFASLFAFKELQEEDPEFAKHARLMIKTSIDDTGMHPRIEDAFPNVRIFRDSWGTEELKAFYQATHVLLAPSRGEGKHMPSLEFQSTGGPVIATNWGGMTEWLHPAYSYPLYDYDITPMDRVRPNIMHNAEVRLPELKEAMLHCFYNRDEVAAKGELASKIIPKARSWENVTIGLMEQLRELDGGEELWAKFLLAMETAHAND